MAHTCFYATGKYSGNANLCYNVAFEKHNLKYCNAILSIYFICFMLNMEKLTYNKYYTK